MPAPPGGQTPAKGERDNGGKLGSRTARKRPWIEIARGPVNQAPAVTAFEVNYTPSGLTRTYAPAGGTMLRLLGTGSLVLPVESF